MIKNFDKETAPLNSYEQDVLCPVIARCLAVKHGRINAVTNKYICDAMRRAGYKINEPRLRKIINHIRTNGLVKGLIATSEGYYIAETEHELRDYAESLQGRIDAMVSVRRAMLRQAQEMFQPQPRQMSLFA